MFNEDRKKRYIEEKMKETVIPEYYLKTRFNESESFEKELQKDICNFTTYEIIDYYKALNFTSLEWLTWLNSHLKMYTQWCLQNNLVIDNQNHYLEIDRATLNTCVNKMITKSKIVSREDVLKWMAQIPNPRDQFIILALFEFGKSKDFIDITRAKFSDISESERTMKLFTGRTVHVSSELIQIAKDADEEKYYYAVGDNCESKRVFVEDGYIVKGYPNVEAETTEFQKGRRVYSAIARNLKYLGEDLMTANAIVESGKLHMIKTRAKELGITGREYIYSPYIEEVTHQYNFNMVRSTYMLKYGDFL